MLKGSAGRGVISYLSQNSNHPFHALSYFDLVLSALLAPISSGTPSMSCCSSMFREDEGDAPEEYKRKRAKIGCSRPLDPRDALELEKETTTLVRPSYLCFSPTSVRPMDVVT